MEAEARVNGILRGGIYDSENKTFTFRAPYKAVIDVSQVSELKIL